MVLVHARIATQRSRIFFIDWCINSLSVVLTGACKRIKNYLPLKAVNKTFMDYGRQIFLILRLFSIACNWLPVLFLPFEFLLLIFQSCFILSSGLTQNWLSKSIAKKL